MRIVKSARVHFYIYALCDVREKGRTIYLGGLATLVDMTLRDGHFWFCFRGLGLVVWMDDSGLILKLCLTINW